MMVTFPLILTAVLVLGMLGANHIIDDDVQRRGGQGGRFRDWPNIPVVSATGAGEAFEQWGFTYVTSDISLYLSDVGDYIFVISDNQWETIEVLTGPDIATPIIILFLLAVIFLVNILLAKYITHRIMTPINTLATGVHEISNGNLMYRIQYGGGDEFDAVCDDFNEMAGQLSDMVKQRQADENSRRELIAGISHDLRTPLASVKHYIEGLRKGVATTPEMQEKYLSTIQSKAEDIEYIIKQLFTFSKIDIGEFPFNFEIVDIGGELREMAAIFADEYSELGLDVSLKENVHGAFVLIDAVQFRNILQNILNNSVKYCSTSHACAEIFCEIMNDTSVSITVKDNGPGVPDEMLAKMFDVFFREDLSRSNQTKGSGLGLAISSKIIRRLNGQIRAENIPEGGLSIIITLPIQKGGDAR